MLDQLPGRPAVVAQDIVPFCIHSIHSSFGNPCGAGSEFRAQLSGTLMEPGEMLLGYHERMAVADGTDIEKSEYRLVLIDLEARDIAPNDTTEYAFAAHWLDLEKAARPFRQASFLPAPAVDSGAASADLAFFFGLAGSSFPTSWSRTTWPLSPSLRLARRMILV